MPLIDGTTLLGVIDSEMKRKQHSGPEYVVRVLGLLDQLVGAVAVLDQANVLHRDIKPSNVLIDRQAPLAG